MTEREMADNFLRTRSESSFRMLYKACMAPLFPIVLRIAGSREEAEELIQEMWIIAIRKLPQFEWKSELRTWLVSIVINLSRKKYHTTEREKGERVVPMTAHPSTPVEMDLEKAIAQLPPGYREVIILHDVEGYKHHEIAEMLQISEGTSKSQLFQARKNLRAFLT